jgi:excisionase family DNA binding protein
MLIQDLPLLLTVRQAEDLTGLERKYLAKLADKGKLKIYRTMGNQRRYYKSSILSYLNYGQ